MKTIFRLLFFVSCYVATYSAFGTTYITAVNSSGCTIGLSQTYDWRFISPSGQRYPGLANAGQSATYNAETYSDNAGTWYLRVWGPNVGGEGVNEWTSAGQEVALFGATYTFTWPGTGCNAVQETNYCYTLKFRNDNVIGSLFLVKSNSVVIDTPFLNTGDSYSMSICTTNGPFSLTAQMVNSDLGPIGDVVDAVGSTNSPPDTTPPTGTEVVVKAGDGPGPTWGGNTNLIPGGTIGDNALFDAISKFANQNHMDLLSASNLLAQMGNLQVNVTNENSVIVTNSTDMSGTTNLLGQIKGILQSALDGGAAYSNQVMGAISGQNTNFSTAKTTSEGMMADSGVTGDINTLKGLYAPPEVGSSGGADMTIEFCGQTLDLDPAVRFPALVTACFWGFTFAAYIWFGVAVSKMFSESVRGFQSQQLGGIPNMEIEAFGTGGNLVGMTVGAIVCGVFVLGFYLILHLVFGAIMEEIASSSGWDQFAGGMAGVGWYLLTTLFPVQTIVSLSCTAIVLRFTIGQITLAGAGAARFLFGK